MLPQLTLVLGGAASGKSVFAETLALSAGKPCLYVATAEGRDTEMAGKIAKHQARRGTGWESIEAPLDVAGVLTKVTTGQIVLIDCATMWLANQIEVDQEIKASETHLLKAMADCASPVIMVSNELGQGVVPAHAGARQFRQRHGEMNQRIAATAGLVVNVIAGIPVALKGTLPGGGL